MSDNICSSVGEQDSITKVTQLMCSAPGEGIIKEMGPIIPNSMGSIRVSRSSCKVSNNWHGSIQDVVQGLESGHLRVPGMRGLSWKNKVDFGLKAQGCPSKDHQGAHLLDFLGNECLGKSMDPKNKAIAPQDGVTERKSIASQRPPLESGSRLRLRFGSTGISSLI
jgi:hypothetical protein